MAVHQLCLGQIPACWTSWKRRGKASFEMKILLVAKYESQDHIEIWNFRNWLPLSHPATRTLRIWCSGENTERSTQIQRADEKALNYNVWLLQDIHYFLIFWQMFWLADVPEWKRHEIISLNFNIVNPLQFCSEFAFYGFYTTESFILSFSTFTGLELWVPSTWVEQACR